MFIAEGVATARTVEMATGRPCVVSGGCERLETVGKAIKGEFEALGLTVILLPDRDKNSAGHEAAHKAFEKGACDGYFLPVLQGKGSDWNDLMLEEGLGAVKEQIEKRLSGGNLKEEDPPSAKIKKAKEDAKALGVSGLPEKIAMGATIKGRSITSEINNPLTSKPYKVFIIRWNPAKKIEMVGDSGVVHAISLSTFGPKTLRAVCPNDDFWASVAWKKPKKKKEKQGYIPDDEDDDDKKYIPNWDKIQNIIIQCADYTQKIGTTDARGPGIYIEGDDVIANYGTTVCVNGQAVSKDGSYEHKGGFYLPKKFDGLEFKVSPFTREEVKHLADLLMKFPFQTPRHGLYLLGFLALAHIPHIADRRPALWLSANFGVGKTELVQLMRKLIPIRYDGDNATEASLRILAGQSPVCVICDEADPYDEVNRKRIGGLVDSMVKNYATGFKNYRATVGQDVFETASNMVWIFSSIQMMALSEAAMSRTIVLSLDESRRMGPTEYTQWKAEMLSICDGKGGSRLFATMAKNAPLYKKNVRLASSFFAEAVQAKLIPENLGKKITSRLKDNHFAVWAAVATLFGEELTLSMVETFLPVLLGDDNISEDYAVGDMGANILNVLLDIDLDSKFTVRTAMEAIISDVEEAAEEEGRKPVINRREAPTIESDHALNAVDALAKYGLLFSPKGGELIVPCRNKKLMLAFQRYGYTQYASVLKNSDVLCQTKIIGNKTITFYRKGQKVAKAVRGFALEYHSEQGRLGPEPV